MAYLAIEDLDPQPFLTVCATPVAHHPLDSEPFVSVAPPTSQEDSRVIFIPVAFISSDAEKRLKRTTADRNDSAQLGNHPRMDE